MRHTMFKVIKLTVLVALLGCGVDESSSGSPATYIEVPLVKNPYQASIQPSKLLKDSLPQMSVQQMSPELIRAPYRPLGCDREDTGHIWLSYNKNFNYPSFTEAKVLPILIEIEGEQSYTDEEIEISPKLFYDLPITNNNYVNRPRVKRSIERDSYGQATVLGPYGEPGSESTFLGPFLLPEWPCAGSIQYIIDALDDYVDFSPLLDDAILMIFTPDPQCIYAGGAASTPTVNSVDFPQATEIRALRIFQPNVETWLHELGHAFNTGHSGRTQCIPEEFYQLPYGMSDNNYTGTVTCGSRAYDNILGYMGKGSSELANSTNSVAPMKENVGWLSHDPLAPHRIQEITASGSYEFRSISEENGEGVKALKFRNGIKSHLFIETRRAYNQDLSPTFDEPILENNYFPQVDSSIFTGAILTVGFGYSEMLFDADRQLGEPDLLDFPTWSNFVLPWGQVFTEPNSGTTVMVELDEDTEMYTAHIELGRTDFYSPIISDFTVNQDLSEPCYPMLDYEISDPTGVSDVKVHFKKKHTYLPDLPPITLSPNDDGVYQFSPDTINLRYYRYYLEATDFASDAGIGYAPNNTGESEHILIYELRDLGGDCPLPEPSATILSDFNSEMPPTFPLVIEFTNDATFNYVSIQLSNLDTQEFTLLHSAGPVVDTYYLIELMLGELALGSYRLSLVADSISEQVYFDVVERSYQRGDANLDGQINIADVIKITAYLFQGDQSLYCLKAADSNDDGLLNIADAIYLSSYLFTGGPPPAEPFNMPGQDPTDDTLSCY